MDTTKEILLKELKKLKAEEFNDFKFYLEEYGSKVQGALSKDEGFLMISPCDLENADRRRTVDLIVQTYSSQPVEVTRAVLEKVGRNDVMESLSQRSSRGNTPTPRLQVTQVTLPDLRSPCLCWRPAATEATSTLQNIMLALKKSNISIKRLMLALKKVVSSKKK